VVLRLYASTSIGWTVSSLMRQGRSLCPSTTGCAVSARSARAMLGSVDLAWANVAVAHRAVAANEISMGRSIRMTGRGDGGSATVDANLAGRAKCDALMTLRQERLRCG